jgi:molybdopterin-guanine dinucleotide biosynthesis protein A
MTPSVVRGAVLAGGLASRFGGRPKGLERVGGERILDRVVQAVQEALGRPPLLVANAAEAAAWREGLRVVPDVIPGCGSLGGIYTAVTAEQGPVLLVAWDMPFVTANLLNALVERADGYDAFLPESDGPRGLEPLCGVYGPDCAGAIRQRLDEEDYRSTGFLDAVRLGTLPRDEVARHGDPASLFFNVNTVDDLRRAEELWRARHS